MADIDLTKADPKFRKELVEQPGGEKILACFTCRTCTASCPVSAVNNKFSPYRIIRLALYGLKKEVLESDFIWLCSSCYACQERCPQGVSITEFMTLLKKKVRLVVMLPEQEIRAKITKNNVKTLSEAVRNFYNGPCAVVEVEDLEDIEEVGNLIKLLVAQDAPALPGTQQALREQPDESGS